MAKRIVKLPPGTAPVFGEALPTAPAPPKERVRTRGEQIAACSGQVAGIRDSLAHAAAKIEDTIARCASAMDSDGILRPDQEKRLQGICEEMQAILPTINACRRDIEPVIQGGIGLPAAKPAEAMEW